MKDLSRYKAKTGQLFIVPTEIDFSLNGLRVTFFSWTSAESFANEDAPLPIFFELKTNVKTNKWKGNLQEFRDEMFSVVFDHLKISSEDFSILYLFINVLKKQINIVAQHNEIKERTVTETIGQDRFDKIVRAHEEIATSFFNFCWLYGSENDPYLKQIASQESPEYQSENDIKQIVSQESPE